MEYFISTLLAIIAGSIIAYTLGHYDGVKSEKDRIAKLNK